MGPTAPSIVTTNFGTKMTQQEDRDLSEVATDLTIFTSMGGELGLLLIQRRYPPFQGHWALPGGFVQVNESLDTAAARELEEETGFALSDLRQLRAYGAVERDPRRRVISVAFYGFCCPSRATPRPGSDASEAQWFPLTRLPDLAFDHAQIIHDTIAHLRYEVLMRPVGIEYFEKEFSSQALDEFHRLIGNPEIDTSCIRESLQELGLVEQSSGNDAGDQVATRLQFNATMYLSLANSGYVRPLQ